MFSLAYEANWLAGRYWRAYGLVTAEVITQDASANLSWTIPDQTTLRDNDSQVVTTTAP